MTVEAKDVPVTYEYVAQTAGFREVVVRARVTGILLKRNYKEGAAVRKGESLFTIDPAPFQVALARAEASFSDLKALLGQTQGNLGMHLAKLEEARYVTVKKEFVGRRPRTTCRLTARGREAFRRHVERLRAIAEGE